MYQQHLRVAFNGARRLQRAGCDVSETTVTQQITCERHNDKCLPIFVPGALIEQLAR